MGERRLDGARVRRHLTYVRTTVSTKGQIVLPNALRAADGIEPGDELEVTRVRAGEYRLRRVGPGRKTGLVDWLLDCPAKGYFQPVASESTDDL
jgi:AbrB family looped-hinge helix DNA binding protein